MSQIRHSTPTLDASAVYVDARDASDLAADFRDFLRRMHRAGRTTRAEHRSALTLLVDLEVIVDGLSGHAGALLDTSQ